jgi:lipoprotein-releasing system permease protein
MKGTLVRGIDPALEGAVTDLAATNEEVLKRWCRASSAWCWAASWPAPWACAQGDAVTLIARPGR